jgi:hypothetical protein
LQAQFSQMRPVAMAPSVGPRMPMFPPGVPGVGQQLFYGQPPPAFINPQVHAHFMMYMYTHCSKLYNILGFIDHNFCT